MKHKDDDVESYENIKTKHVESYETQKHRTLSPMKHKDRGR